jgi:hypothetical protein
MKAIFPVGCLLVGLLSAFNSGAVMAAFGDEQPAATTPAAKSPEPAVVKKVIPAKKVTTAKTSKPVKKRAPIASKSKPASEIVKIPLPPANLDLSLPQDMVNELQPPGTVAPTTMEPLLPQLIGEKPRDDSPFQLNGRLLNNQMGLQLRNEERRDVEGAALDFKFKQ